MKYLKYIFLFIILIFVTTCKPDEDDYIKPTENTYLIKIDSIHMPSIVKKDSIFEIEYFGIIGTNDCYSFKEFFYTTYQDTDSTGTLIAKALGNHYLKNNCLDGIIYLDGHKNKEHKQKFAISQLGVFKYIFMQPSGTSYIIRYIIVENK